MSNIQCGGCGSEWFTIEKRVTISDERYLSRGIPRYTDGKTLYLCQGCGEPLDIGRLEITPPELSVFDGAIPLTRTLPVIGTVVEGPDGEKHLRIGDE